MGNVACCKKPNELIEDKDVYKKSTIKKTDNLQIDQIEPQNPFEKANNQQENNNIILENTNNNNLLDLEKSKNTNNFQYTQKIEHKNTNGPSDNLRKKRVNRIITNDDVIKNNDYNNIKTRNIFEQINNKADNEYNKMINKDNNINTQIISNDDVIMEKKPEDKINIGNNNIRSFNNESNQQKEVSTDINTNINNSRNINLSYPSNIQLLSNSERNPPDSEKTKEKKMELINTDILDNNPTQIIKEENINEQNNDNNDNNKEEIENNIVNQKIEEQNNIENMEQKVPLDQSEKEQLNIQDNLKININNNINSMDEEPQNSMENPNLIINNNTNNPTYIPQNIIQNNTKTDSQLPDDEDPKDTNEMNPKINNINDNQEQNDNNEEENSQLKEAFLQNADGEIIPTQQISDSEIAILYQQCLSKGETEPDDDFNPETYKKFYPEDDPFFIFDKGEVADGQIISSPDEPENLEIYEGEINEDNKKHGQGILTTPEYVRKGTWRNGEFTGWGRESRRNKEVLEGKFINGLLNGKGIFKNSRNNLYTGDFVDSKKEGLGELYTNRIHYIGEFKADKLDGKGIIEFLKEGHKYEGDFKNNEINGRGVFQWKNGDVYEGDMTDGKMNGVGIYRYADGQIYEGEYLNGIREGKGRIIVNNMVIFDGEFREGHRVVKGRVTSSFRPTNNGNADNNDENYEYIQNN